MTPSAFEEPVRPEIVVDLGAIRHNVTVLRELVAPAALMVVVKADGYGHGMVPVARAARAAGAAWLGVATVEEALALRATGDTGRLLCWMTLPGDDLAAAAAADIDVTAYSVEELDLIVRPRDGRSSLARSSTTEGAGPAVEESIRVQLKVDTGLSRGGAALDDWPELVARAAAYERTGRIEVTGVWSHLACADEPGHPANDRQETRFAQALDIARRAGLTPEVCHLANSAGAILRPGARYDLVRCGLAAYGLDPAPGHTPDLGLVPAMTVRTPLAFTKRIAAGEGVSYGHRWIAPGPTRVGLVPVGYGDGVPRHASDRAEVAVRGVRRPVRGRVCMDQLVVELFEEPAETGDVVTLFGPGSDGEPTAQEWAEACDTISYEIVTRIGGRLRRRHVDTAGSRSAAGAHLGRAGSG